MLVCPSCGAGHRDDERFCRACGLPLTLDEAPPVLTERQQRARKVLPQYGEGRLVKVGYARNQPEAEFLAGMLLEEGIPSVIRRAGGFDVPDFLAAGPRDILVAASGADAARQVLNTPTKGSGPHIPQRGQGGTPLWVRSMALLLVAITVALVAAGVVAALLR
jgi:hypothetical protein